MLLLLLGRIIQIALATLQIRLVTTLLKPSQYGVWILLQTVISFFVMLFLSPMGLYLNRHVIDWEKDKLMPVVFRAYTIFLSFVSIFSVIFFIFVQKMNLVNLHTSSVTLLSLAMSFFLLSQTFHQTWIPSLNFLGKRKEFVIGSSMAIFLGLLVALLFAFIGWKSVEVWSVAMSVGFLVATLIFIPKDWYQFNAEKFQFFKKTFKLENIFQFSVPLFFSTLFLWFQTQGYRFIIEKKIGITTFGQFAAGYAIVAGLFAALEAVLVSFYQPRFYQGISRGGEICEELKHVWDISLYPYFLAACFLFLLAPEIANIFLHENFISNKEWISWVVIAEGFRVLFNLVCINFHGTKKTLNIAWPHFLGVILTLSLFFYQENPSYTKLLISLGAGYLLSIILLLLIDFKIFLRSLFFKKLFTVIAFCSLYFVLGFLGAKNFEGISKIIFIVILGFIFTMPYYLMYLQETIT